MADQLDRQALQDPSVVQSRAKGLLNMLKARQDVARQELELAFARQNTQATDMDALQSFQSKMQSKKQQLQEKVAKAQEQQGGEAKIPDAAPPEIPLSGGRGGMSGMPKFGMTPGPEGAQERVMGGPQPAAGATGALMGTGMGAGRAAAAAALGQMGAPGGVSTAPGPGIDETQVTTRVPERQLSGWERFGAFLDKDFTRAVSGIDPGYEQNQVTKRGASSEELMTEAAGLYIELEDQRAQGRSNPELESVYTDLTNRMGPDFSLRARARGQIAYERLREQRALSGMELRTKLASDGITGPDVDEGISRYMAGDQVGADQAMAGALDRSLSAKLLRAQLGTEGAELRMYNAKARQEEVVAKYYEARWRDYEQRQALSSPAQIVSSLVTGDWYERQYGVSLEAPDESSGGSSKMGGLLTGDFTSDEGPDSDNVRAVVQMTNAQLAAATKAMFDKEGNLIERHKSSFDLARQEALLANRAHPLVILERNDTGVFDAENPTTRVVDGQAVAYHLMLLNGIVEGNPLARGVYDANGNINNDRLIELMNQSAIFLSNTPEGVSEYPEAAGVPGVGLYNVQLDANDETGEITTSIRVRSDEQWALDNGNTVQFLKDFVERGFIEPALRVGVNPARAMEAPAGPPVEGPPPPEVELVPPDVQRQANPESAVYGRPRSAPAAPARRAPPSIGATPRGAELRSVPFERPGAPIRDALLADLSGRPVGPAVTAPLPRTQASDKMVRFLARPKNLQPKSGSRSELIRGEGRPMRTYAEVPPWAATAGEQVAPILVGERGQDVGDIPRVPRAPAKDRNIPAWMQPWVGRETMEGEYREPPKRRGKLPEQTPLYRYTTPNKRRRRVTTGPRNRGR